MSRREQRHVTRRNDRRAANRTRVKHRQVNRRRARCALRILTHTRTRMDESEVMDLS